MSHELRTPLNSILILGQQLADNPERQPDRQAGRVRAHHPRRRHRPAEPDHRHPRPVEDRVGHGHGRRRGGLLHQPARHWSSARSGTRPRTAACRSTCSVDPGLGRSIVTDSKRLQQVLKNLLSNAFKFTAQGGVRLNVSAVDRRLDRRAIRCSSQAATRRRLRGLGHRHRHPAREAADHLRGVPAGRRQHQPQVRRHRPRPGDQPRAGQPARRRDPAAQHARASAARSRSTCRCATSGPTGRRRASRRRRRAPAPAVARRRSRVPERAVEPIADDRDDIAARRRRRCSIVEDDPHYARVLVDLARDNGLQGAGRDARRRRAGAGAPVPARPRSRSTSSCPTCSAGRCSAS